MALSTPPKKPAKKRGGNSNGIFNRFCGPDSRDNNSSGMLLQTALGKRLRRLKCLWDYATPDAVAVWRKHYEKQEKKAFERVLAGPYPGKISILTLGRARSPESKTVGG